MSGLQREASQLRRTGITASHIASILRWFFTAALFAVALAYIFFTSPTPAPGLALALLSVALLKPALWLGVPRSFWGERQLLLSFVDLGLAAAMYYLTGGNQGPGGLLLHIVVALAAARLILENALVLATVGSVLFSTHLIVRADNPSFFTNLYSFGLVLWSSYAVVFIVHFAVTGQREAEVRRARESSLQNAERVLEQQQMLITLSREITNTSSLDDMLRIVLQTLERFVPFQGASIALLDHNNNLYTAAASPTLDPEVAALRLPLGQGLTGWIAEKQQPLYAPDVDRQSDPAPAFRSAGGNAQGKAYLGVPLVTRGRCIGVLQVDSSQTDAFRPEHQQLLQTVAAQISGAIENARLLEDRRDFSRRLQLVYQAANELTGHFDMDAILEEFTRRASELLDARYGAAAIFGDQSRIDKFVTVGITEEESARIGPLPEGHGLLGTVFTEQKPVRLDDLTKHPQSVGFPPHHPVMRTLLAAPLVSRGELQGAIYLSEKRNGQPFTEQDEELLLLLASGASAAISNARLYLQLRRNIEQLYALHQIGQAIGSSLSQDEVIRVFNLDVRRLCGAEASVISEWNPARSELETLNNDGPDDLLQVRQRSLVRRQLLEAARSGQAASLSLAESKADQSVYGYIAPLTVRGRVIGIAEIYAHTPVVIAVESSSLFLTLTAQLAVSIENARLYMQLQRREQQLRNFVGRLFQAEDGERRRLAYDIHDGLAQLIVSADIHMNNYISIRREDLRLAEKELEKGLQGLKASLTEVRRVVSELRPSTLDDFGLVNTLRRHVEQLAEERGWEYTFDENLGEVRLDPTLETGVFRIVQESLNNIRKYSDTQRVQVELKQEGEFLNVRVQDWGKGFDMEEARQREGHFGLSSMEERARLLGGSFDIKTRPGEGTIVEVRLPCYRAVPA